MMCRDSISRTKADLLWTQTNGPRAGAGRVREVQKYEPKRRFQRQRSILTVVNPEWFLAFNGYCDMRTAPSLRASLLWNAR